MNEFNLKIESIKDCIDYFIQNNFSKEKVISCLSSSKKLNRAEKNIIFVYLYPRNLLDRELISRIIKYRGDNILGSLTPDLGEVTLLIEAYRTSQYSRYLKHLFHSFTVDNSNVFPIDGTEKRECGICGKKIVEYVEWNNNNLSKEYLAYGSENTGISLCLDCLIQLKTTHNILSEIEGNKFLPWG